MPIPKQVRAGDLIQWRDNSTVDVFGEPISSPDWTVTYYLRTNTSSEGATVSSTAYTDDGNSQLRHLHLQISM